MHLFAPERKEAFHLFSYANTNNIVSHQLFKDKRRALSFPSFLASTSSFSVVFVVVIVLRCLFTLPALQKPGNILLTCHKAIISLQLHHKRTTAVPEKNSNTKQNERDWKKKDGHEKTLRNGKGVVIKNCVYRWPAVCKCSFNAPKYSEILWIIVKTKIYSIQLPTGYSFRAVLHLHR